MLEIRNLTKIYQTKNVVTTALDNVSLKFPDKGMVFLLGKSGSGKSTLLNVCGGLDTPTDGEIIVKGRSSKTFSGSDFDSYRNTYIGFIFQEYNILNEFSVEDNIGLALELQGKQKDIKKINELLEQVDLVSFAKRKPNTLSGGQKQRIAIARALIKSPEIIMADEPTGALDSNTGKQVLDTLKKLSKTKLVIVVSHDREFAEYYGDRIIELKDGKVISDISKSLVKSRQVGSITMIDNNTISIKNGVELTNEDLRLLNDFVKSSDNEILISNNQKEINDYKKQNHISTDGAKETFVKTNEEKYLLKQYTKDDANLIKSKLPLKHAFRIGTSSLRLKPIRLLFTILLSIVSFVLLGVVSTMTFYNAKEVAIESIINSDISYIPLTKGYKMEVTYNSLDYTYTYDYYYNTLFSNSDVEEIKTNYGNNVIFYYDFTRNNKLGEYISDSNFTITNVNTGSGFYYSTAIKNFAYVDLSNSLRQRIINGTYPTNNNEIMISSFLFDSIKAFGYRDRNGNSIILNDYNDIVNKTIVINRFGINFDFKVSGVYDVNDLILQKYQDLLNIGEQYNPNIFNWEEERKNGIYSLCLVSDDFYKTYKDIFVSNELDIGINIIDFITIGKMEQGMNSIAKFSEVDLYDLFGNKLNSKNDDSIALSTSILRDYIVSYVYSQAVDFQEEFYRSNYDEKNEVNTLSIEEYLDIFAYGITYELIGEEFVPTVYTTKERLEAWKKVYSFFENKNLLQVFNVELNQPTASVKNSASIVGFTFANVYSIIMSDNLYNIYSDNQSINYETYKTSYQVDKEAIYSGALVTNTKKYEDISKLINDAIMIKDDDSYLSINSPLTNSLDSVNAMIDILSSVFFWAGIVLATFATLLLFNFISVSITNKKREIGILRAVGARSIDVFKIFFSESLVIVTICCVSSIIISSIVSGAINSAMAEGLSGVQILFFGIPSILLIVTISIIVSIVSTFLPVYSIAKKKPVDSIRAI